MPELLSSKPTFTPSEALEFSVTHFGLSGQIRALPSERDQNFKISDSSSKEWVLKISNSDTPLESIQLQEDITRHLNLRFNNDTFPACPTGSTETFPHAKNEKTGRSHPCRIVPYREGTTWASYTPINSQHLEQLGVLLGKMTQELQGFEHPGAHRHLQWDLLNAATVVREGVDSITSSEERSLIMTSLKYYEKEAKEKHQACRRSIIHGDANDHNIVINHVNPEESPQIALIDFGDAVHSSTINDLAIAMAYALFDAKDPLASAAKLVAAFHQEFPLQEEEISLLPILMEMRLCTSLTQGAINHAANPDDPYLIVSLEPARQLLRYLGKLPPKLIVYTLRKACGFPAHPNSTNLINWIKSQPKMSPIVDNSFTAKEIVLLDLGMGSPIGFAADSPQAIDRATRRIAEQLFESRASIGIGKYNEPRFCYRANQFATPEGNQRTIHLGIDLFLEPRHPVKAPFAGRVHSVRDNNCNQDYGPTVILEHQIADGPAPFFTLFGHLGRESISHLKEGQNVQAGEVIGYIGTPFENGGWPPHLHFQLMTDMLGYSGNFPGVTTPEHRDVWLDLCPDPGLLLGIDQPPQTPSIKQCVELKKRRQNSISPSLSLSYREPLHFVQGHRQYLYDSNGREYLDGVNNVCHVGHSHPHVVQRISDQASLLNTNTRYLHENLVAYAEKLTALFPAPLNVCFFVCSGSEANDLALRIARTVTRSKETIVIDGAYHGNLSSTIEISPYKYQGPGGFSPPDYVHKVATPDSFREKKRRSDGTSTLNDCHQIDAIIEKLATESKGPPVFIAESILSCAGQIVLPPGYLEQSYQSVRRSGGLCIADEVQVGFGRVGSHFWGFETQNVVPDIVTLGKPIGNGHPIGAVITTREIADSFDNGMEYFNTYGGNPVSCAAGLGVLEVMEEEDLQTHASIVGEELLTGLRSLQTQHPFIGDVRGMGLFLGIEFVTDPDSLSPAADIARYVVERLKSHRILLSTDGPQHNVIKIKPPLPFSKADVARLLNTLESIFNETPLQSLQRRR
jgi:4-aminobutyrate aminotransferase-like enzyme/Ser/Thr protein kinase RdoA (MazF antagonist)